MEVDGNEENRKKETHTNKMIGKKERMVQGKCNAPGQPEARKKKPPITNRELALRSGATVQGRP